MSNSAGRKARKEARAKAKKSEASSMAANGQMARVGVQRESWRPRTRSGWTFTPLREAKVSTVGRTMKVILVTEGPGNKVDKNFYTKEFIADAAVKYEGKRAFLNHQTEAEREERSEGDIKDQFGSYRNLAVRQVTDPETGRQVDAVMGDVVCDESDAGDEALAKGAAQVRYAKENPDSKDVYAGLSINGGGIKSGTIEVNGEAWNKIVGVAQADSVDLVTRPARGGKILAITESAKTEVDMNKKLIKLMAALGKAQKALEAETNEAAKTLLEADIAGLQVKLTEASKKITVESEDEDEGKEDESEDESDDKSEDDADGDDDSDGSDDGDGKKAPPKIPMDKLKKKIPKGPDESDKDHEARIKDIHAACTGGEAESAREAFRLTPKTLRNKFPAVFASVAESVRRSIGEERNDVKGLKAQVRALTESITRLSTENTVVRRTKMAEKLLESSRLPKHILSVDRLVRSCESEQEMKDEIEYAKAILQEATGGSFFNREAGARGGGNSDGGLDAELDAMLESVKD